MLVCSDFNNNRRKSKEIILILFKFLFLYFQTLFNGVIPIVSKPLDRTCLQQAYKSKRAFNFSIQILK